MESLVRKVNSVFRSATAQEISEIEGKIALSDRQEIIFGRYYVRKQDVNFIADTIGISPRVISHELSLIRRKIASALSL